MASRPSSGFSGPEVGLPAHRARAGALGRWFGGGPTGNERLTAATAALLFVLLFVEGVTILLRRPLLSVHVFVGMVLIPPVVLKLASTGYRFASYYAGRASYRLKGPPPMALRVMGPAVIITTLLVLGSGVALLWEGPHGGTLRALHKVSFIAWLGFMTVHVLAHLAAVSRNTMADLQRGGEAAAHRALPGRTLRGAAVAASLIAGLILAAATIHLAAPWLSLRAQ